MLYRNAGRYSEAVEAFRQIPQVDSGAAPRASVEIIDTWRMAKDLNKAQEEATAALKKFPKDRMVKLAHASLLADMGKIDEAVAELRALLDGEKDRETHLAIAQVYEKGKRFADMGKALDAAEQLSESKQDKQTVIFMRGAMLERTKQYRRRRSRIPQGAGRSIRKTPARSTTSATCWPTATCGWTKPRR